MTAPPSTRPLTDAVVNALTGAITIGATPVAIGDADAPAEVPPYIVVNPISSGFGGDPAAPESLVQFVVQITAVGAGRSQAQWLRDKARQLWPSIVLDGLTEIRLDVELAVTRDDDAHPDVPTFVASDRWRLMWDART